MDLSVVIVNWNSKEYLRACLASLRLHTVGIQFEVIVVDSGSFDGVQDMLRDEHSEVRFVQSPSNIGFARANNLGATFANGSLLLFLNPDTEVRDNALAELVRQCLGLEDLGVAGPKLRNSNGSLQTSCVQQMPTILNQLLDIEQLQRWFPRHDLWTTAASFEGITEPVHVEAVSGACIMMRRQLFEEIGGFSSDYFMYAEDLDLAWKAGRAGWRNYYLPMCEVVHHGGGSTQRGRSHFSDVMVPESVSRLLKKTHGRAYSGGYRFVLVVAALFRLVLICSTLPFGLLVHRRRQWAAVFRKWVSVLRWGLGLERWVKQYGVPD
jgi:GT2 family glycosyltransferase